jgi:hypothetical protein
MIILLLAIPGVYFFWRLKTDGLARYDLLLAWAAKYLAACIFLLVYTNYYGAGTLTADPQAFMEESTLLRNVARESFGDYLRFLFGLETPEMVQHYLSQTSHWSAGDLTLINDSKNVIRVNSILRFFSGGNSYLHVLVFSFLSTLGLRELYKAFRNAVAFSKRGFWFALVLLPSVIFWTGSILKEPLMIIGLCLVLSAVFGELSPASRTWRWSLGLLLLLLFKPYVLGCLVLALGLYYTAKWLFAGKAHWSLLSFAGLAVIVLLAFPVQRQQAVFYLSRKQFDFVNIGRGGLHAYADTCFFYFTPAQFRYLEVRDTAVYLKRPLHARLVQLGKAHPFEAIVLQPNEKPWFNYYMTEGCPSRIDVSMIRNSGWQLLRNTPEACFNAGFRPLFGDPGGGLKYFAIVETILLTAWTLFSFRYWRRTSRETRLTVITLLVFAVALLVLIGWITPVLGAIVRYRIPAYLAILLASLLLYKQNKRLEHE